MLVCGGKSNTANIFVSGSEAQLCLGLWTHWINDFYRCVYVVLWSIDGWAHPLSLERIEDSGEQLLHWGRVHVSVSHIHREWASEGAGEGDCCSLRTDACVLTFPVCLTLCHPLDHSHELPLSSEFSRLEYSCLACLPLLQEHPPDQGINPGLVLSPFVGRLVLCH